MNKRSIRRSAFAAGVLALAMGLSACSSSPVAQSATTDNAPVAVNLAIAAPGPNPIGAWGEGGQAAGIFAKAGLDLKLTYLTGTATASTVVQSGQALAAFAGPEPLPAAALGKEGDEMVSIYQASYSTNFPFGFLKGSAVQSLQNLKGARVGVLSAASAGVQTLDAALRDHGLSLKDVQLVPIGVGQSAITAVRQGEVDFLAYYQAGYTQLQLSGIDVRVENYKGTDQYPGQVIFTTRDNIKNHPQELQSLVNGVAAAYEYCSEQPEQCVDGWAKQVGVKDIQSSLAVWKSMLNISKLPAEAEGKWGWSSDLYWKNLVEIQMKSGIISRAPDVQKLYSNQFVDAVKG